MAGGGAYFFRALAGAVGRAAPGRPADADVAAALWDLAWSGRITGDTLAPLRGRLGGGRTAHRTRPGATDPRPVRRVAGGPGAVLRRRAGPAARSGPPAVAGRWALLPEPEPDPTVRAHAVAEVLLDRYGVVTRGAVAAERVPGGYAAVYKVLAAAEEAGRVRRGYFVEGLGAAQFAGPGAVDRLRAPEPVVPQAKSPTSGISPERSGADVRTLVLAAADPANPYGAALPWPARADDDRQQPSPGPQGRRAGRAGRRRAGALRRARRSHAAVLERGPRRRCRRPPTPWPSPCTTARWAG